MKAAHRPVEVRPGDLGVVLGFDQPLLGPTGLGEQFLIQVVYCN
jgi:hypothetical protein